MKKVFTLALSLLILAGCSAKEISDPPVVTAPEGQQFLGWFREIRDENGDTTLQLMFTPDENGKVSLPHGYVLEHMVLFARYGKEGA